MENEQGFNQTQLKQLKEVMVAAMMEVMQRSIHRPTPQEKIDALLHTLGERDGKKYELADI